MASEIANGIYNLKDELEGLANLVRYTFDARVILCPDYDITSIEKQSVT